MFILPRLFLKSGGWMAVFLGAILIIIVPYSLQQNRNAALLAKSGVTIEGTVIAKQETQKSNGRAWYFMDFTYLPKGQAPITIHHREVTLELFEAYTPGDPIPVSYVETQPQISSLNQSQSNTFNWSRLLVNLGIFATFIGLGWRSLRLTRRAYIGRNSVQAIVEGVVVRRKIIKLISEIDFTQIPQGSGEICTSFPRFIWGHGTLRQGVKIEVALCENGTFWVKDLLISRETHPNI